MLIQKMNWKQNKARIWQSPEGYGWRKGKDRSLLAFPPEYCSTGEQACGWLGRPCLRQAFSLGVSQNEKSVNQSVLQGDHELGMLRNVFRWTQFAKGRTMTEAEVFPRIKALFLC